MQWASLRELTDSSGVRMGLECKVCRDGHTDKYRNRREPQVNWVQGNKGSAKVMTPVTFLKDKNSP